MRIMTIKDILDQNKIVFSIIYKDKKAEIIQIKDCKIIIWENKGNVFKMRREWFDKLSDNCNKYYILLVDSVNNQTFFIKFIEKNNWLSSSFLCCEKEEIYLGKQVLQYKSDTNKIISEIIKI